MYMHLFMYNRMHMNIYIYKYMDMNINIKADRFIASVLWFWLN